MIETLSATGGRAVAAREADSALAELYRAHYRSLVRLAALLLDDRGLCEEVVQDAFVRIAASPRRLSDYDNALAYIRQSVVNGARSKLRRRLVAARHAPPPRVEAPAAEGAGIAAAERVLVVRALRSLPQRQREAVVLRYYGDLSEAEIAAAMGVSAGSVKSHLSRGRAALATQLEHLA